MSDRDRRAPSDTSDSEHAAGPAPSGGAIQLLIERFGQAGAHQVIQRRRAQRKAASSAPEATGDVQAAAAHGTSGAGGALPHLDAIQKSFGKHDVSQVKAHTDGAAHAGATAMGAEAFASGDHVAFAAAPSLHTAAHEAAHVVQQRGGVQLKGGVGEAGDPYEQHADAVADKVVRGESAEPLLDAHAGGGGGGAIQRRLMTIDQYKVLKGTATKAKPAVFLGLGGGAHSTSDEEKIFTAIATALGRSNWAEALRQLGLLQAKLGRMDDKDYWQSDDAKQTFMNSVNQALNEERNWVREQMTTAAPQALGTAQDGATAAAERPVIKLVMGQGLTANLSQAVLCSDEFSTCSPIVMFNSGTRVGGLFHFPALALEEQRGNLKKMYDQVQPTAIYLYENIVSEDDKRAFRGGHDRVDARPLKTMFQQFGLGGDAIQIIGTARSSAYTVTLAPNGTSVQIEAGMAEASHDVRGDKDASGRSAVADRLKGLPAMNKFGRDDWLD